MSPTIEIDSELWDYLKQKAEPFTDTPNSVLRRLLDMEPLTEQVTAPKERGTSTPARSGKRKKRQRAPAGSLLPESEYELPILRALDNAGGRAPAREVVGAVGGAVESRLTEMDKEELPNGGKRWENRVQFTRLRLKERGLISSGSPRGIWELSEQGRELLGGEGAT